PGCLTRHYLASSSTGSKLRRSAAEPGNSVVKVGRPPRVTAVVPLEGFQLRLTFSDGLIRELDFDSVLSGGVFQGLRDPAVFREVRVDDVAGTISWPNGVDLDPDVLHGDYQPANGPSASLIREYRLPETG